MMKLIMHSLSISLILSCLFMTTTASAAISGTVTGTFRFHQMQGNYCPNTRDCTGAKYPQSHFDTSRPFANIRVYVERASDGIILGQSTTDSVGNFTINFYDPSASGSVDVEVTWRSSHKDNRFSVRGESGAALWRGWTSATLSSGPNHIGIRTWGTSASPNLIANLYDGARMVWENSLSQSNRMITYFNNVQIRAFDTANACPTSCANGPGNYVLMDPNSALRPQARVMHELGHIASYRSSRDQKFKIASNYNFGGNSGWSLGSAEWAAAQFEEAVATHFADVALYFPSAKAPHTCNSNSSCITNSFNIETSLGTSPCGVTNGNRQPINAIRYLWDNYDSVIDGSDTLSRGIWEVCDTIHAFNNGTNNREKNEPWNAALTSIVDNDGRSPYDFLQNWITWGTNSSTQYNMNCLGGIGD